MEITGKVVTGLNRGAKFLALSVYYDLFTEVLGEEPYCGTLNVEVDESKAQVIGRLFADGVEYDNLLQDGRPMGGVIVRNIVVSRGSKSTSGVVVRPLKSSHEVTTLEIVASLCFREQWEIQDGEEITVRFI